MKKTWFLKALGISLFLLTALFFTADKVPAVTTDTYIEFSNIGIPSADAKYLKWEIKANLAYDVVVYMVDDDGSTFQMTFSTTDATNAYTVSSSASYVYNIGTSYFSTSPSTATFTANLSTLMNTFFILGGTHTFTAGNSQARVSKVRIYGDDVTLYSICIANNSSYSNPGWQINASDFGGWTSVTSFKNNDGNLSDTTTIDFSNSSYLHVTKTVVVVDPYTGYQINPSTGLPYGYSTATAGYPTGYGYSGATTGSSTTYYDPRTGQYVIYDPTTGQYRAATATSANPYATSGYPYATTSANPYATSGYPYTATSANPYAASGYPYTATSANPYAASGYPYTATSANPYAASGYPYTATSANPYAASGYPYTATSANPYAASGYPYTATSANPYAASAYPYGATSANPYAASAYPYAATSANPYAASAYPYGTAAGYGQQPLTGYGQQYLGGYGAGLGTNLGLGGINSLMGLNGGMMSAMYPPLGLTVPPAGMNMGMGFDPFGFGLGLTGLGAFDPLSIAALANGYGGLGMLGMGGLGLY